MLGALSGGHHDNVVGGIAGKDLPFGSKSLSPIAVNKRQVDEHMIQDKYSSSFLKSGNDEVVI